MVGVRARESAPLVADAVLAATLSTCDLLPASIFGPSLTYAQAWFDARTFAKVAGVSIEDPTKSVSAKYFADNEITGDDDDDPWAYYLNTMIAATEKGPTVGTIVLEVTPEGLAPAPSNLDVNFHYYAWGEIQHLSSRSNNQAVLWMYDLIQEDQETGTECDILRIRNVETSDTENPVTIDTYSDSNKAVYWSEDSLGLSQGGRLTYAAGAISEDQVGIALFSGDTTPLQTFARIPHSDLYNLESDLYLSGSGHVSFRLKAANISGAKGVWLAHDRVILWADDDGTEKLMVYSFNGKDRKDLVLQGSNLVPVNFAQGIDSPAGQTPWKYWLAYDKKSGLLYVNNPWWDQ